MKHSQSIHFAVAAAVAACLATPLVAQVTWIGSGHAEAPNAIRVGNGDRRLCRATYNGDMFNGHTSGSDGCSIQVGDQAAVVSSGVEVAIGLAGWDVAGARPANIAPVVGGLVKAAPQVVCRVFERGAWYAGWFQDPGGCRYVAEGAAKTSATPQYLYPLDPAEAVQLINTTNRCVSIRTPTGSPTQVIQLPCGNGAQHLWRVHPQTDHTVTLASVRTGQCLAPGTAPELILTDCNSSAARLKAPSIDHEVNRIRFHNSNMLTVPDGSRMPGLRLEQTAASTRESQGFRILNINDAARRLQVVAYNTMLLDRIAFPLMGHSFRAPEILAAIDRDGEQPDVLILSEVFDLMTRFDVQNRLIQRGYTYFYAPFEHKIDFKLPIVGHLIAGSSGMLIASRWPITATGFRVYSNAADADDLAAKGVAYASINKLGRRYHVFGTHLQSGFDNSIIRMTQINEIASFIQNRTAGFPSEPILIGGDMNIDMEEQPFDYQLMLNLLNASFPNAPRQPGHPVTPPPYRWTVDPFTNLITNKRGGTQEFLDYLLVSRVMPTSAEYRVIGYQSLVPFVMSVRPIYLIPFGEQAFLSIDLSDHSALRGAYRYPSAPLVLPVVDPVDGNFRAIDNDGVAVQGSANINGQSIEMPVTVPLQPGSSYTVEGREGLPANGARWTFDHWKDGQPQTFTFVSPASDTTHIAIYRREYELNLRAVPAVGGTVAGGGWYAKDTLAEARATAATGFRFTGFSGDVRRSDDGRIEMDSPRNVAANFVSLGKPVLYAATAGARSDSAPGQRLVPIRLQNTGQFPASGVRITGVTNIQVLSGTGTVSVSSALPVAFDGILPGGFADNLLLFNWPTTATRVRFTLQFAADNGYTGSTTLNIFR